MGKSHVRAQRGSGAGLPVAVVADVMTSPVSTLAPDRSVLDAVTVFGECKFRHLLVVDGAGALLGVVSDRDALRSVARGQDVEATAVDTVMTRNPVTVSPATPIGDAVTLMMSHRINCLPVVEDGGRVRGIVTTTDLLRALHEVMQALTAAG